MQGAGCRAQGAGCRVQVAGCRVRGAGCDLGAVKLLELAVAALPAQDQKLVTWREWIGYQHDHLPKFSAGVFGGRKI